MLSYWRSSDTPCAYAFAPAHAGRYLTFDLDPGGLNNIRMALEYAVVLAAVTGRTLVLPPPQPWYLLHSGPIHAGPCSGSCGFSDIFDMDALSGFVSVITTADFIGAEQRRYAMPASLAHAISRVDRGAAPFSRDVLRRWRQWLFDNTHVMTWNPYESVICVPDIGTVAQGDVLTESFVDRRELVE